MCVCVCVIEFGILNSSSFLTSHQARISSSHPSSHTTTQAARLLLLLMTTTQGELIFALVRGKTTPLRLLSRYLFIKSCCVFMSFSFLLQLSHATTRMCLYSMPFPPRPPQPHAHAQLSFTFPGPYKMCQGQPHRGLLLGGESLLVFDVCI